MSDSLFLIAKKVGMTTVFNDIGKCIPVTLIHIPNNYVVAVRSEEKCGYNSIVIGSQGLGKHNNLSKPQRVELDKTVGSDATKISTLKEFRLPSNISVDLGENRLIDHNSILSNGACTFFDVTSVSKGKGFQGPMKRHNFSGLRASHGVSVSHRSHGSTGNRKTPSKVFKGKRMAGRMGCSSVTVQNLKFVDFDQENNVLLLCGAVPGAIGSIVYVRNAIKKISGGAMSFNGLKLLRS